MGTFDCKAGFNFCIYPGCEKGVITFTNNLSVCYVAGVQKGRAEQGVRVGRDDGGGGPQRRELHPDY